MKKKTTMEQKRRKRRKRRKRKEQNAFDPKCYYRSSHPNYKQAQAKKK
jgi:hypothetical protein